MQNPPQIKSANCQKSKSKSRINKRQRNRRRNKLKLLNSNQNKTSSHFSTQTTRGSGSDIWREAYENAVRWHCEHQGNYWRSAAENLQRENQMLRQHLQLAANTKPDVYYETSDEDEEEEKKPIAEIKKEKDEVDTEYLEFLQITFKHREELRLKRQAEAQEVSETPLQTERSSLD